MKTGRSLNDVAVELARQRATKRDFWADTRNIGIDRATVASTEEAIPQLFAVLSPGNKGQTYERFPIRHHALRQLEDHLGVPAKFADRLMDKHPDLLVHNLNTLLHRAPSTQLVRTLDGHMRAFLSNSYRPIDNFEYANAVLEVASKFPVTIESCEVTESRLYLKVVRTDMEKLVGFKPGWQMGKDHNFFNRLRPAAVFSNSEIGAGSLWFRPGVYTKECTNLAVMQDDSFQKVHLGRKGSAGEEGLWEVLSDQTKALADAALWSQVKDLTAAALGGTLFEKHVAMLENAVDRKIEGDPMKTVEVFADKYQLNETEQGGLMRHLIEGGVLSQYGLHSAVTRLSQDVQDYDRASELECLGGRVIELQKSEWQVLAQAA